jgi:hypothetical protein
VETHCREEMKIWASGSMMRQKLSRSWTTHL